MEPGYPKLLYTCDQDGLWVLGPGPNPRAVIARLKDGRQRGVGPLALMSIVAHLDLDEWTEANESTQGVPPRESID
jgi:hypothetical protein